MDAALLPFAATGRVAGVRITTVPPRVLLRHPRMAALENAAMQHPRWPTVGLGPGATTQSASSYRVESGHCAPCLKV